MPMEMGGLLCPEGFGIGEGMMLYFVLGVGRHFAWSFDLVAVKVDRTGALP